ICLCHEVERGFGHLDVDPAFAKQADETGIANLDQMLAIESELKVKATYSLVGVLFPEARKKVEREGHCLAFHSYDHTIAANGGSARGLVNRIKAFKHGSSTSNRDNGQLAKCRDLDYRIKGYRPPQSKITPELSDKNLLFHNFEWLAGASYYMKTRSPQLSN